MLLKRVEQLEAVVSVARRVLWKNFYSVQAGHNEFIELRKALINAGFWNPTIDDASAKK